MLIVAQAVATNALHGAADHHEGYQRVKLCLHALEAVTALHGPLVAVTDEGAAP